MTWSATPSAAEPGYHRKGVTVAILIAALADENCSCRPATSEHSGAGEPAEVYGAGSSGAP
jgi:hypothetical protein